jgi:hypothetical protein
MKCRTRWYPTLAAVPFFWLVVSCCLAEATYIPLGQRSVWKYYDQNFAPRPEWRNPDFDDSAWASGLAPLGYGEKGLNTTISFGGNPKAKTITAYFRHSFYVARADEIDRLFFLIRYDDGFVAYLNGKEILRSNLPEGAIGFDTRAMKRFEGYEERLCHRMCIPASELVSGCNVLAVEVHQVDPASSDLVLDLALRGFRVGEDSRPVLRPEAQEVASLFNKTHCVGPGTAIPDGYLDGGRGMKLEPDGHARSAREILVVDRAKDEILKDHVRFARSQELRSLNPIDRVKRLAAYICEQVEPREDGSPMARTQLLVRDYANEAVLIGEVGTICGGTVCRHRSLLFKLLGDEAGLGVALVRGNYKGSKNIEGHAWNELCLEDGTKLIVDITLRRPEDAIVSAKEAGRYWSVQNKPMYEAP